MHEHALGPVARAGNEVGDIARRWGDELRKRRVLRSEELRALAAFATCRTPLLGGQARTGLWQIATLSCFATRIGTSSMPGPGCQKANVSASWLLSPVAILLGDTISRTCAIIDLQCSSDTSRWPKIAPSLLLPLLERW